MPAAAIRMTALPGATIEDAAADACLAALATGRPVVLEFNRHELLAMPDTDPADLVQQWSATRHLVERAQPEPDTWDSGGRPTSYKPRPDLAPIIDQATCGTRGTQTGRPIEGGTMRTIELLRELLADVLDSIPLDADVAAYRMRAAELGVQL